MSWTPILAAEFRARFRQRPPGMRRLGREGEHPVVHADGSAFDIAPLWAPLHAAVGGELLFEGDLVVGVEAGDLMWSAEVGRGTIELIVGPCDDLHGIRAAYERAMAPLVRVAEAHGAHILGYGIQPLTPPTPALMTPKQRYGVLLETLGDLWLSFALTASDQVHVDVTLDEVAAATSTANLLAPFTVGLCGNSSVASGAPTGFCSTREAGMGRIGAEGFRHGMTEGPSADIEAWITRTFDLPYFMHKPCGRPEPYGATFRTWLDEAPRTPSEAFEGWLYHEHYVWNAARPRVAHGTVELRSACQQPWPDHMAASALGTAFGAGHVALGAYLREALGGDPWPALRRYHGAVVRSGLAADEPVAGLVEGVLERAHATLVARGRGEEVYLAPLFDRWAQRENPAQRAIALVQGGGIEALVAALTVK